MEFRNCRYTKAGTVNCEINHPQYGWIPFHATPDDVEQHGREIYAEAIKGEVAPYEPPPPPPPPTDEEVAAQVRRQRDSLLAQTDWTQLADVPQATKDLWDEYRQALRDVPQQDGFPHEVIWPDKPE